MGEKKVTIMVLKVNLQCSKCYKKVKKVLCKFPLSCSPEEIRDKLCCKGEGVIKSIEILKPDKKPNARPPQPDGDNKKPQQPDKENPKPPPPPPPVLVPCYPPVRVCCKQCSEGHGWGPCHQLGLGQETSYDWCYARLVHESWGGSCHNRVYCRGRCSDCTCEGNPPLSCTIS